MSVVVAFDRLPVAVFPDLEAAACAVEQLPLEADDHVTCYALRGGGPDLRALWSEHVNGTGARPASAAGGAAPVTLSFLKE